jgi:hypothetical protein
MFKFLQVERFTNKEFFFRVQKIGWKFIGFWPGSDDITKIQLIVAVLNAIEVLFYCIFQFYFCYVNRSNLLVVLDALTPCATQLFCGLKILVVVWKRKDIKVVLDHLKDSFYFGKNNFKFIQN